MSDAIVCVSGRVEHRQSRYAHAPGYSIAQQGSTAVGPQHNRISTLNLIAYDRLLFSTLAET
ncbi:hypothetical protein TcasGA2_TC001779 [Tribolium castaneum]|uniref:Uncharacterized protein n=1 Tax=Tribolium castaneum TaxID=7070 RepID=D6W8F8_TRICA|nr:hypothetical protein TcasGA2_TC001779 [Tribolium castaneum]